MFPSHDRGGGGTTQTGTYDVSGFTGWHDITIRANSSQVTIAFDGTVQITLTGHTLFTDNGDSSIQLTLIGANVGAEYCGMDFVHSWHVGRYVSDSDLSDYLTLINS